MLLGSLLNVTAQQKSGHVLQGDVDLPNLATEADLIAQMLHQRSSAAHSIDRILEQPAWWNERRRLTFIAAVSDYFAQMNLVCAACCSADAWGCASVYNG